MNYSDQWWHPFIKRSWGHQYDSGGLPGMTWYALYTGYTWYQVWYLVYHGIPWFIWFTWYDSGGLPGMTKIQRKTLQCIGSVYKKWLDSLPHNRVKVFGWFNILSYTIFWPPEFKCKFDSESDSWHSTILYLLSWLGNMIKTEIQIKRSYII